MYYVYILKSVSGGLYIGSTGNLKTRIYSHNSGKVKSTKSRLPIKLIYYEAFLEKSDALKEERFLKSGKGRERIKLLLESSLK